MLGNRHAGFGERPGEAATSVPSVRSTQPVPNQTARNAPRRKIGTDISTQTYKWVRRKLLPPVGEIALDKRTGTPQQASNLSARAFTYRLRFGARRAFLLDVVARLSRSR